MKKEIEIVLNEYLNSNNKKTDKNAGYHKVLEVVLPNVIENILQRSDIKVKSSGGQGIRSDTPAVCLCNTNITDTPKNGIYIAYLFKANMKGFYLTICQGITDFGEKYKSGKSKVLVAMTEYFKQSISDDYFTKGTIILESNSERPKLYEKSVVISKEYINGNYTDEELISDLKRMLKIYDKIYETMKGMSYNGIVEKVIDDTVQLSFIKEPTNDKVLLDNIEKEWEEVLQYSKVKEIENIEEKKAYYNALMAARNPSFQKRFKNDLMGEFNGKCALCDINAKKLLIGSHILPYSECKKNEDMVNRNNGLLLCIMHDALFDKKIISFDQEGKVKIKNDIHEGLYDLLNIDKNTKLPNVYFTAERKKFLKIHYNEYQKNKQFDITN